MKKLILVAVLPFLFIACGPKIYKSQEFSSVSSTHKTVAILPAVVSIQLRPNQAKKSPRFLPVGLNWFMGKP